MWNIGDESSMGCDIHLALERAVFKPDAATVAARTLALLQAKREREALRAENAARLPTWRPYVSPSITTSPST